MSVVGQALALSLASHPEVDTDAALCRTLLTGELTQHDPSSLGYVDVLVAAVEDGVPRELRAGEQPAAVAQRFGYRRRIDAALASWVVETWAWALSAGTSTTASVAPAAPVVPAPAPVAPVVSATPDATYSGPAPATASAPKGSSVPPALIGGVALVAAVLAALVIFLVFGGDGESAQGPPTSTAPPSTAPGSTSGTPTTAAPGTTAPVAGSPILIDEAIAGKAAQVHVLDLEACGAVNVRSSNDDTDTLIMIAMVRPDPGVFGAVSEYVDAFNEGLADYEVSGDLPEEPALYASYDDWSRTTDEVGWFIAPTEMQVVVVLASFERERGRLDAQIDILEGSESCPELEDDYWTWLYDPERNPDYDRYDEFTGGIVRLDDFEIELYDDLIDGGMGDEQADCVSRDVRNQLLSEGTVGRAVFELRADPDVPWTEAADLEAQLAEAEESCAPDS